MFKKMDEMEKEHALKSIRVVYLYTLIFIAACIIADGIKNGSPSITSNMFLLLMSQNLVFLITRIYFKVKVGDPDGKTNIWITFIILTVGFCLGFGISFIK